MRRIIFGTSILVLGIATLMWPTSPVNGGKGHGGGGHAGGGGGHAAGPAHVGSVHYAAPAHVEPARVAPAHVEPARVAPARVEPSVRAGSVRSEHYAGSPSRGGYRNPYRDDYFRRFRPGYSSYLLDGAEYYGYGDLPIGYQNVVLNGITYYLFDGVYYEAYIYDGQTVYLAIPDPT